MVLPLDRREGDSIILLGPFKDPLKLVIKLILLSPLSDVCCIFPGIRCDFIQVLSVLVSS